MNKTEISADMSYLVENIFVYFLQLVHQWPRQGGYLSACDPLSKPFFVVLSKTRHRGRHENLVSTLCLTQCDPPPPFGKILATPLYMTVLGSFPHFSRTFNNLKFFKS